MLTYIARRLLIAIPVLFGVMLIAFLLVRMLPGDPVYIMSDPESLTNTVLYEARREALGLNDPLPVQFAAWAGEVLQGNLGFSFHREVPVWDIIYPRIWPTVLLTGSSILAALAVGIPAGLNAALRQNSAFDYTASAASMLAISIPAFFLGMLAIYVFSLTLGWLPAGGMRTVGVEPSISDTLQHLILPAGVLAAVLAGPYTRYTRQSVLDVIRQEYVTTADAKGVPRRQVVRRHILRNALIPLTTVVAIQIPSLLAGAVVIETVFSWPGMGLLVIESITSRDYPVILAIVMLTAVVVMLFNLLADVITAFLDPRVRL